MKILFLLNVASELFQQRLIPGFDTPDRRSSWSHRRSCNRAVNKFVDFNVFESFLHMLDARLRQKAKDVKIFQRFYRVECPARKGN
jgi:hypothetical protein